VQRRVEGEAKRPYHQNEDGVDDSVGLHVRFPIILSDVSSNRFLA